MPYFSFVWKKWENERNSFRVQNNIEMLTLTSDWKNNGFTPLSFEINVNIGVLKKENCWLFIKGMSLIFFQFSIYKDVNCNVTETMLRMKLTSAPIFDIPATSAVEGSVKHLRRYRGVGHDSFLLINEGDSHFPRFFFFFSSSSSFFFDAVIQCEITRRLSWKEVRESEF